jgi:Undecaprenyl-phosphate galactose phosphotransferase WbaP
MATAKQALINAVPRVLSPAEGTAWSMGLCILTADVIALLTVFTTFVMVRHSLVPKYPLDEVVKCLPFVIMAFPALFFERLYPGLLIHPAEEMRRVFHSLSAVFLIWATMTFLWRTGGVYSRAEFLVAWAASAPAILFSRHLARRCFSRRDWWGVPAVILGSGLTAQRVARKLRNGALGLRVTGVFSESQILSWTHDMPPVLGDISAATNIVGARVAQYAIVAVSSKSNVELRSVIEDYCRGFSHILLVPDMPGVCSLGVTARDIQGELGLEMPQRLFHFGSSTAKRALDLMASISLIVLLAPLFAVIAMAIKFTSKGPVLYRHMRHGRNGTVFSAIKFRTMVSDADTVLADYLMAHPEHLLEWQRDQKLKADPRITAVGKWLRRSSLDELPQLINVLVGQMSLVGPRPIVGDEIPKYGRGYDLYTRVLPGITGLWQVSGRNNTTYDERVALDEYYVHNWSVWLDLYILVRTIRTVVTGDGAF